MPGMCMFTRAMGETVQVIGDDYLVTSAERVRGRGARRLQCRADQA